MLFSEMHNTRQGCACVCDKFLSATSELKTNKQVVQFQQTIPRQISKLSICLYNMHSKQFIVHDFSRSSERLGFLEAGEADLDLKK